MHRLLRVSLAIVLIPAAFGAASRAQAPAAQVPNPDATISSGRTRCRGRASPKGEVRGPFTLPSEAYPGHAAHLLGLRAGAVRPGGAGEPDDLQRRPGVQEPGGRPARAERARQPDLSARDPGDARRCSSIPGRRPEQPEPTPQEWGDRTTNRPTEYNSLDDKYARVIVDELMPALYKDYNISKDPEHARHRRRELRRDRRVHGRLGAAEPLPQGAEHDRQLRQPARRPRLCRHRAARARRSRSGSSCRTAATTIAASAATATTTRRATGSSRTCG